MRHPLLRLNDVSLEALEKRHIIQVVMEFA